LKLQSTGTVTHLSKVSAVYTVPEFHETPMDALPQSSVILESLLQSLDRPIK